jgi:excisionase family DNA binding protein
MTNVLEREYLTAQEAAGVLRVNVASIYRACARGSLPAVRLAPEGNIRIPADALMVGGEERARGRTLHQPERTRLLR